MSEIKIERRFVKLVKDNFNIRAIKFKDPARRGAPDRLILLPGGRCLFIEFKKPGEDLREEQEEYHEWLRYWGHAVHTCTSEDTAYNIVRDALAKLC